MLAASLTVASDEGRAPDRQVRPAIDPPAVVAPTSLGALFAQTSSVVQESPAPAVEPAMAAPDAASPSEQLPRAIDRAPVAAAAAAPAPVAVAPAPGERWRGEGFVLVFEGQEWDSASLDSVEAALSLIPARIRAQLGNRALGGMSILVNRSGRTLSGKQPYGSAANFFSTNDGRNELVLFPGQSVPTILHELGHSYNLRRIAPGRYATVLLDPEMQSFMAVTGWRVISTPDQVRSARDHLQVEMAYDGPQIWPRLSNNDPLEDFANSFALYFFAPEDLRAKSPERVAWFESNVGH